MAENKRHKTIFVQVGKVSDSVLELSYNRLMVVMLVFGFCFSIVVLRLFDVAVLNGAKKVAFDARVNQQEESYKRADIVDRNGMLLAINLSTASVYANPRKILDTEEAVLKLRSVLPELSEADLLRRLKSKKQFVWIKRSLTPAEQYAVNSLGIPGIDFKMEDRRIYPHKRLFSHVLGFADVDGNGLSGVEKQFDTRLKDMARDNSDQQFRLSVDVRVQNIMRDALMAAYERFSAKGATGIVMDVDSGEILSMVNLPDFNPHNLKNATKDQLFNRATLGVYEMGSTFKTFTMAMGLESEQVKMKDQFDVTKPIKADTFLIKDFHSKDRVLSFPEVFMYSSNIGSAKVAMEVGPHKQRRFLKTLGLLDAIDIELPERAAPLYPESWGKISGITISYGHGIAVTPVHLAQATSVLLNGGYMVKPTLLPHENNDRRLQVVSSETSEKMRKLFRYAVEYGTGSKANARHYLVGGKTGSADKVQKGGYKEDALLSSFVGVFPMHKPKYLVFVMLDEPTGDKGTGGYATGGMVAAPVVRDVVAKIGPLLNVDPVDASSPEIRHEFWFDYGTEQQDVAAL